MKIFDGRAFAREKEAALAERVRELGRQPVLAGVLVGDDPGSTLYQRLKREAAERVGIQYETVQIPVSLARHTSPDGTEDDSLAMGEFSERVKIAAEHIGERDDVDGVMVQLPIPGLRQEETVDVLSAVPVTRDVDGLRWRESGVKPAAVKAILSILDSIANNQIPNPKSQTTNNKRGSWTAHSFWEQTFVVVGAGGQVGTPLTHFLRERGTRVLEVERETPEPEKIIAQGDVIVSCVGKAGVVKAGSVRDGVVVVDVGMSSVAGKLVGDMGPSVYEKASVAVPVPGGVGPVTVVSLLENLVDIVTSRR